MRTTKACDLCIEMLVEWTTYPSVLIAGRPVRHPEWGCDKRCGPTIIKDQTLSPDHRIRILREISIGLCLDRQAQKNYDKERIYFDEKASEDIHVVLLSSPKKQN
jgi:hypothetical protein